MDSEDTFNYLPADHYVGFLKYNFPDWIQVFFIPTLSKISICLFLLRIFKFERWRNFLFGLIGFIIIMHTPLTILFLLQCTPLNKSWDISVPGHCFSKLSYSGCHLGYNRFYWRRIPDIASLEREIVPTYENRARPAHVSRFGSSGLHTIRRFSPTT